MDGEEAILVNERQAAKMMGVSIRTMYTLRREHGLPYVKICKRVLYDVADMEAWIHERKVTKNG